jgi:predicted RNA-binding Zn-ribbon protein involved in translation (DUF1610 family)
VRGQSPSAGRHGPFIQNPGKPVYRLSGISRLLDFGGSPSVLTLPAPAPAGVNAGRGGFGNSFSTAPVILTTTVRGLSMTTTLYECTECGHQVSEDSLYDEDGEYMRCTLRGNHSGHPDDRCPDEYVTVCPDCGEEESFEEVEIADDEIDEVAA